ncbi:MAG: TrmB family transcriptional regulator [Ignavibacteria bacterium]|nr:TrmB family transcriptional regulator [Ignavibacteria bacterium]
MEDIIKKLEILGFTIYESKVFTVLMSGHNMTAAEIAEKANIPRTSVYDILKSFAEKGFCNEIQTSTKLRYEMIDPDVIEGKIQEDFDISHDKKLKELKSSFATLKSLYKAKEPDENKVDVELIKGFNKFRALKFMDLLRNSEKEMLLMNRMEAHVSKQLDDEVLNFYKKGGKVRSIYEASLNFKLEKNGKWVSPTKDDIVDLLLFFQKQGEEIKLSKTIPQNMAIFDGEIVFLSLMDLTIPRNNRTDVIIRNKNFATYMVELFELYWSKSHTIDEFKNLKSK